MSITQQILMALTELGIVIHGDVKPSNILWDREKGTLKLVDFGSAQHVDSTEKAAVIQNPCYRAPEVVLGRPYDQSIDMWGLGCIIYDLCTLELLFPVIDGRGKHNDQLLSMFINTIGLPPNWDSSQWVECRLGTDFAARIKSKWKNDPDFAEKVIDLLQKILCYENRITPEKALNHKLFK